MKTFVFVMRNGEQIEIVARSSAKASRLAIKRGLLSKDDFFDVMCIVEKNDVISSIEEHDMAHIIEKDWDEV